MKIIASIIILIATILAQIASFITYQVFCVLAFFHKIMLKLDAYDWAFAIILFIPILCVELMLAGLVKLHQNVLDKFANFLIHIQFRLNPSLMEKYEKGSQ